MNNEIEQVLVNALEIVRRGGVTSVSVAMVRGNETSWKTTCAPPDVDVLAHALRRSADTAEGMPSVRLTPEQVEIRDMLSRAHHLAKQGAFEAVGLVTCAPASQLGYMHGTEEGVTMLGAPLAKLQEEVTSKLGKWAEVTPRERELYPEASSLTDTPSSFTAGPVAMGTGILPDEPPEPM